ncbi:MAG: hypothetical protein PUF82_02080 [Lactobacillus equicursoris]|uniref:hypothetical protein n=2 Tax=Lactobacillus equicursoris TaxID=420645 RepID=UPI00242A4E5B|nr:hypothetical protein [Lactobacillus equicursoris]MDD6406784.1 hypothetical protein [Lactobacillus equicursoris]
MTMINELLTDYDRVCLTKKAYEGLNVGDDFVVNGKLIGRIVRDVYAQDGMQAYVIENQAGRRDEVTVLFKGSSGLRNGNATTWRDEWLNTNWPIFVAMLTSRPKLPSALKTASSYLNKWLVEFPDAIFYIYGHSLGAINAAYALANCRHPSQIGAAYLYEGTNIWRLLTRRQRQVAGQMRHKINTYVDIYDPVTLGYTATHKMVGKLHYVDSLPISPIKQHMWGGYRFDDQGRLLEKEVDSRFLQSSQMQTRFLSGTSELAQFLSGKDEYRVSDWKKITSQKLTQVKDRVFNQTFLKDFEGQDQKLRKEIDQLKQKDEKDE